MPGDLPKRRSTKTDHEHLWSKINDELILMMTALTKINGNTKDTCTGICYMLVSSTPPHTSSQRKTSQMKQLNFFLFLNSWSLRRSSALDHNNSWPFKLFDHLKRIKGPISPSPITPSNPPHPTLGTYTVDIIQLQCNITQLPIASEA